MLSELSFRSKAHWGYEASFLDACRADLALTEAEISGFPVYLHAGERGPDGYYRLVALDDDVVELDALFVDAVAIGTGVGRCLWQHAVSLARDMGFSDLVIQSDPNAEGFYRAMGAERIGESESTVMRGRTLPLLRFALRDERQAP
ncbi:MAG: GNAT family N-acetyltransferase [Thermomicrobiales bacterium]|nr:GNAT family N-acetyltransferase [Thermomicrobiales bacterium]